MMRSMSSGNRSYLRGSEDDSALRGGKGRCDFLSDQKVTKESPGTAFDEHVACGRAHRRLVPGPLFTRVGNFGAPVVFGGQNQDRFPSYSRPTGAFCYPNLKAFVF